MFLKNNGRVIVIIIFAVVRQPTVRADIFSASVIINVQTFFAQVAIDAVSDLTKRTQSHVFVL